MNGRAGPAVVGLSTYAERARWAVWDAPATLLPANYAERVAACGAAPVLLPPVPGIAAAAGRLDALILTGGGDVDPARYGADPDPRTGRVSAGRDRAELELLEAALAAGLPVLGICRGLQIINVALGGTLRQHLPPEAGHAPAPGTFGSHPVRIAPGSRLAEVLGPAGRDGTPWLEVPTAHHQAVGRLGDGLAAVAWAADGAVEAAELAPGPGRHPFVLGVQWHPEAGGDQRLIEALVAAAGERAGA